MSAAAMFTPPPPAVRAVRAKLAAQVEQGTAARTWAAIPSQVRCVLVMLALDPRRDVESVARMPWGSFTQAQQADLGALARQFRDGCADAGALR